MKKITFLIVFLFSLTFTAQNKESTYNKWLFKVGANLVDNSGDSSPFDGLNIQKMAFSNQLAVGLDYRFTNHWSIGIFASINKFKTPNAEIDGSLITKDLNYFASDLNIKYYLWGAEYENINSNRFNMYVSGGVGYFEIENNATSLNFGGGLIYWLNDDFGVNVESVAKWSLNNDVNYATNHFQHFLGITYRFSTKKDSDGDGISDKDDNCPNTFGLKEFNGCPDTDNDGITDAEDDCPEIAGLKINNGCLDSDKDGIIDPLDKCKNTKGPKENNGCPYKDTDNDGVFDKDDACPTKKGPKENKGCPKVEIDNKVEVDKTTTNTILTNYSKSIYFETGKHSFKYKTYTILKEVVKTLKQFPDTKVIIEGHTDNVGKTEFNKKLSQERANSVKKYLVNNGIPSAQITAVGFGESQPASSNNSKEGKAMNRRVIIFVK